jgi:hypothetical protein
MTKTLAPTDLIRLPYTPDLTEAGLLVTCQRLAATFGRLGKAPYPGLRRRVSQVAVELAFRRLLVEQNVPFRTLEVEPFSDPHQHDLSLGGHHCHLVSTLISQRSRIRSLRGDPACLLQASASIPLDPFVREGQTPHDLFVFAFLLGLAARTPEDQRKIQATGQPHYYMALLPENWSSRQTWAPLDPLTLESDGPEPVKLEMGGQNADRDFIRKIIQLQPNVATPVPKGFYSLAYLHNLVQPAGRIKMRTFGRFPDVHSINPNGWGNLWVYGMEIWLAGWLTQAEFRQRSSLQSAGPFPGSRAKSLAVPIHELRPLNDLFEQVHAWDENRRKTD